jgi:hypothetical protein
MPNVRPSIERSGWRNWLDEHRSPQGFGSREFDILAEANAPVTVFVRIWKKDRRTIEKYLEYRKRELGK